MRRSPIPIRPMKISAPKELDRYFEQTEHAVRHLYSGLEACRQHWQDAQKYWNPSLLSEPMSEQQMDGVMKYVEVAGKYFDLMFSQATYAGSILQVAHIAVRLYSRNTSIPQCCADLLPKNSRKVAPFCIGPLVHGVPIGLIVYAGRNQYNHWDDDEPHAITTNVFNALTAAFKDVWWADLSFDLSNQGINVYSLEILQTALQWNSYDEYLSGVKSLWA